MYRRSSAGEWELLPNAVDRDVIMRQTRPPTPPCPLRPPLHREKQERKVATTSLHPDVQSSPSRTAGPAAGMPHATGCSLYRSMRPREGKDAPPPSHRNTANI